MMPPSVQRELDSLQMIVWKQRPTLLDSLFVKYSSSYFEESNLTNRTLHKEIYLPCEALSLTSIGELRSS